MLFRKQHPASHPASPFFRQQRCRGFVLGKSKYYLHKKRQDAIAPSRAPLPLAQAPSLSQKQTHLSCSLYASALNLLLPRNDLPGPAQ